LLNENPQTLAVVQYHVSDDYALPFGEQRSTFYGVVGIPAIWFDGVTDPGNAYAGFKSTYDTRRAAATDVTIAASSASTGGQNYKVTARVGLESGGQSKTVRVYVVQVLDHWPTTDTPDRNMFKQAGSTADVALTAGQEQTVERTFTLDADSKAHLKDVKFIAWAQEAKDSGPAEVYQAAIVALGGGSTGGKGTLVIDTSPVKGIVCVDQMCYGVAPQTVQIASGIHTVWFEPEDGYVTPPSQDVEVRANETTRVQGVYLVAVTGTLAIETTPVNGTVYVDGQSWGFAPQSQEVVIGTHTVTYGAMTGYAAPPAKVATVYEDSTTRVIGTYVPYTGVLAIETTPVAGEVYVDGQKWGTAPQCWLAAVGSHTVSFGDFPGYTKPASQTVSVESNRNTLVLGTYTLDTGRLSVDTTPVKGDVFVDGVIWGAAPQSRTLPTGQYTVTFGVVPGYTTPAAQQIAIAKNQTTSIVGDYQADTGTLSIQTTPIAGAVSVDGTSWGTAPQSRVVPVGSHRVSFAAAAGYTKPADQNNVAVQKDQTTEVTGTYTPDSATLSIDTKPVKGEVFVDGQSWGKAPQSRQVALGPHTVSYGDVSNYVKPPDEAVTLVVKGQTLNVTGTYAPETGTLSVETAPVKGEVFVDGLSWGVAPWTKAVAVGDHQVSFGPVDGYTAPAAQQVAILKSQTAKVSATYVQDVGTLAVETAPLGAVVLVDGVSWGTAPQSRSVPAGLHSIIFSDVDGYITPPSQQAIVTKGQTTSVVANYLANSGSGGSQSDLGLLVVATTPAGGEVFVDGVSWGTAPQQRVVSAGTHTVTFGAATDYTVPAVQQVAVVAGRSVSLTGTYTAETVAEQGTLSVVTTPVSGLVFVDGTSWGTAPQGREVAAGPHGVSFGIVQGYTPPDVQLVTVQSGETRTVTGEYVAEAGQSIPSADNQTLAPGAPCFGTTLLALLPLVLLGRRALKAGQRRAAR
jgi:hypothetical protein